MVEIEKEELEGTYKEGYFDMIIWAKMLDRDGTYKHVKLKYQREIGQNVIREGDGLQVEGCFIGRDYEKVANNEYNVYPEIWVDKLEISKD